MTSSRVPASEVGPTGMGGSATCAGNGAPAVSAEPDGLGASWWQHKQVGGRCGRGRRMHCARLLWACTRLQQLRWQCGGEGWLRPPPRLGWAPLVLLSRAAAPRRHCTASSPPPAPYCQRTIAPAFYPQGGSTCSWVQQQSSRHFGRIEITLIERGTLNRSITGGTTTTLCSCVGIARRGSEHQIELFYSAFPSKKHSKGESLHRSKGVLFVRAKHGEGALRVACCLITPPQGYKLENVFCS